MIFKCSNYIFNQKKPCKTCKYFSLWGIGIGHCFKHNKDKNCASHCKYYKRYAKFWSKNGKCKIDENEFYA